MYDSRVRTQFDAVYITLRLSLKNWGGTGGRGGRATRGRKGGNNRAVFGGFRFRVFMFSFFSLCFSFPFRVSFLLVFVCLCFLVFGFVFVCLCFIVFVFLVWSFLCTFFESRCEIDWSLMWNRFCDMDVKSLWNRCEIDVESPPHPSTPHNLLITRRVVL